MHKTERFRCLSGSLAAAYCNQFSLQVEHDDHNGLWNKIKIIRLTSPLFYVNAERVKNRLLENTVAIPDNKTEPKNFMTMTDQSIKPITNFNQISVVILDMTSTSFIDLMGINALKDVRIFFLIAVVILF